MAIALTAITSTMIGVIIFTPDYYLEEMGYWWLGLRNFFNLLMFIRLICIAYLYQFEQIVRQHLISVGEKN
ncbi:MAG: hypothetical protein AAGE96_14015 [Cyanobacteria bacterium P01_G01_bin.19]